MTIKYVFSAEIRPWPHSTHIDNLKWFTQIPWHSPFQRVRYLGERFQWHAFHRHHTKSIAMEQIRLQHWHDHNAQLCLEYTLFFTKVISVLELRTTLVCQRNVNHKNEHCFCSNSSSLTQHENDEMSQNTAKLNTNDRSPKWINSHLVLIEPMFGRATTLTEFRKFRSNTNCRVGNV